MAEVTSSRRKSRAAHFGAPSHIRRKIMSSSLTKELRKKYGIRSIPVRKDDEVLVVRGNHKGEKGKVIQVYRKKWAIYIDKITKNKADGNTQCNSGAPRKIPINASNIMITKLKEKPDRLTKIEKIVKGINARKGKADKKIRATEKALG
jgi:large subunit ribosomal protein L26e